VSGGGFEGDAEAQRGELADVVADLAGGVDAMGVVVGSQVVEACGRVGQQVPNDDQDRARDRDEGFELAAAFDQTSVALAEEGVRLGRRSGGFAEHTLEIGVALAGGPATLLGARTGWCAGRVWSTSRSSGGCSASLRCWRRRHARAAPCRDRWWVNETYVKVSGRWRYVYRAIDQFGPVIDVYVSPRRDRGAARCFFTRALATTKVIPWRSPLSRRRCTRMFSMSWPRVLGTVCRPTLATGWKPITGSSSGACDRCADNAARSRRAGIVYWLPEQFLPLPYGC
jgi:hypothetical protein